MKRGFRVLGALRDRKMREEVWRTIEGRRNLRDTECPCCGFFGKFDSFGLDKVRMGANCPRCQSKERHRLLALAMADGFIDFGGHDVLHFAAEPVVGTMIKSKAPARYVTADLEAASDLQLNIEAIALPDQSFDRVVCSHVLEHVDDSRALKEIRRILCPGGYAVLMIPIVEGWSTTYEDPAKTSEADRARYFGQYDHVRFFGADFRDRVRADGFDLDEYTAGPEVSPRYGLQRGEKVFKATRPL